MIAFLTSSPCMPDSPAFNPENGFVEALRAALPERFRVLVICSDPENPAFTASFAAAMYEGMQARGLGITGCDTLDGSNAEAADKLIAAADCIILAGGHVPTQNRFFTAIGLREKLQGYDGVILGVSAGSMNAADRVYAQPEESNESIDPNYQRWLTGLGLTRVNLLPHLQMVRNNLLDGKRLFEDITLPDSIGHRFYAIPDGSYLYIADGCEELRGESWLIEDGNMRQLTRTGQTLTFYGKERSL